jgi:hypothetical protein
MDVLDQHNRQLVADTAKSISKQKENSDIFSISDLSCDERGQRPGE